MLKDLEKMMMKKKDSGKMDDQAKQAKMEVLQELMQMCQEAMGNNVKSGMDEMKKVSVMAPDKESLLEGLEKAEEVVESPMMEKMEEMSEEKDEEKKEESEDLQEKPEMKMVEEDEDESPFNKKRNKLLGK